MTNEQKAAYIYSQSIVAMAVIEGMKAANEICKMKRTSLQFKESDFLDVITDHNIHSMQVRKFFDSKQPVNKGESTND